MVEADAPAVARLEQQTLSPWSLSSLLEELQQDRGVVFVAEKNAHNNRKPEIVGWCACRYIVPESELLKISVSNNARRSGIATALLKHLSRFLSQKSIEILFLEVRSENKTALNFYRKSGFLKMGERPGYYLNPADNASLFQKNLMRNPG